jgi:hypothetical protein
MKGCSVLYFTMSISPDYLEAAANLAVTAKSLGVKAFVSLSQMTVSEMSETTTTSSPHQKQHWLAEQMTPPSNSHGATRPRSAGPRFDPAAGDVREHRRRSNGLAEMRRQRQRCWNTLHYPVRA